MLKNDLLIAVALTVALTACGGEAPEGDAAMSSSGQTEANANEDSAELPPRDWNFLKGICIIQSGDIKTCSEDGAFAALGASVQPVVYLFFDESTSGAFVAINKLKAGIATNPLPGRLPGPEDDTWPSGTYYPNVIANKSAPSLYEQGENGLITVIAEVDYNCTFTSDYVMLDERLYQGPSSNAGECGDMREQSNLMTNRMREQEGVKLLGFGETKFLEKKYIYK